MDEAALQRKRRERAAFHALYALALDERESRLAELALEDAALAAAVRATLAAADADAAAESTLGSGRADPAGDDAAVETVISGRFRLVRLLGVGGMGEVHLAERIDGVEQRVALKIVRSDLPIPHARALRERQILARLNHPHIAGLVDAGIGEAGQPWFAMEYVEGERITDWCDRRCLDLRARALLMARVCAAVQFAHRNLVLHRDLKPSNVLVDADGHPKLLDFGIAKLLDATDEQDTRTLAMTPAYAAPEQLRGEAATTSSDIYQLGLMLYELGCGVTVRHARALLPAAGTTVSLPRQDRVLATLAVNDRARLDEIARHRHSAPDRLRRQLGADFSRIVAKACDEDPRSRYATAQALADDLERWALGLPVSAHHGSFAYRLAKLVRRHALAASLVALLSLGLVATTLIALDRTVHEREQRQQAERERESAQAQHRVAEQQRRHAETLVRFLNDVFREGDPNRTQGAALSAAELLGRASAKLDRRTDLSDATRAVLLTEIADVFNNLGQVPQALEAAQQAHALLLPQREQAPIEYLQSVATLAHIRIQNAQHREAAQIIEAALPLARRTSGGQHRWHPYLRAIRAYSLLFLARGLEAEAEAAAAIAEFDAAGDRSSQDLLETLGTAAAILDQHGDPARSAAIYERAMAVIEANSDLEQTSVLRTITNKGTHELDSGRTAAAIATFTALLPRFEAMLGPADLGTLIVRSRLALAYLAVGDPEQARDQLAAIDAAMPPDLKPVPIVQRAVETARARHLIATGRFTDAEVRMRDLLSTLQAAEQSKNARAGVSRVLAEALLQQGRAQEAADQLRAALAEFGVPGNVSKPSAIAAAEDSLGRACLLLGDAAAIAHLERAAALSDASQGQDTLRARRSAIHLDWARGVLQRDPQALTRLAAQRQALVRLLGGETFAQIWQLDLLTDRLARELGQPGIDPSRRRAAQAGLARITGLDPAPDFVGLTEF